MEVGNRTLAWSSTLDTATSRPARRILAVCAFVVLTTAGAYAAIPVPWTPVPMTLQPLAVLLAGLLLGPSLGAASMASYVALGLAGLPVFAGGQAGVAWLLGPTGGFILAFPAAAFVAGWTAGPRGAGTPRLGLALVAGLAVLYTGGVSQLALLTGRSMAEALALGALPFVAGDLVEVLAALAIAARLRPKSLDRL